MIARITGLHKKELDNINYLTVRKKERSKLLGYVQKRKQQLTGMFVKKKSLLDCIYS